MPKQIWLSPILNTNRERLIERASEVLGSGPAFGLLYLTASRPLLELVTERLLDGVRCRGIWGSLPVHLFRGLVRHILTTAVEGDTALPLAPRIAIDQEELPLKRSLFSRIIKRLAREGKLTAIAPLAGRDGCINTVASLIGEIQRACKTPAEFNAIVEARLRDSGDTAHSTEDSQRQVPRQVDFDREIASIYQAYASALDRLSLTEDDADGLRALAVLRGELDGKEVSVPWLRDVRLLVLDGFFDFTPVQGEILRLLIPQVPDVIVNLNRDESNREIFRPFDQTIDQLCSMAEFEVLVSEEAVPVAEKHSPLRERLFNPALSQVPEVAEPEGKPEDDEPDILLLECSDRQTEIRAIAKEIKRLVLKQGYRLSDIALVVRERAAYEEKIVRIFEDEGIPCALGHRVPVIEVPAVRAAVKLIELLVELSRNEAAAKMSNLADLIKSEFFRLSDEDIAALRERFEREYSHLPVDGRPSRVGEWNADELENVIAFVGAELRVDKWLARARQLTAGLPDPQARKLLGSDLADESDASDAVQTDLEARAFVEGPPATQLAGSNRKPKPSREVHPASIAWSAMAIEFLSHLINAIPREAPPRKLRDATMKLLDQLQFADQIQGPLRNSQPGNESPSQLRNVALDLRGVEGMRRAFVAAVRSFEMAERGFPTIKRATFFDEFIRSLDAQTLRVTEGNRDGLSVLEVTDVRGLRFRAVFIAGLVEGGFPLRASRDWIYPHEERERLKQYGLTLEDISTDTLLKEEHYFYQAACRAAERLYLSRPLVLEDGSETVASYYINELKQAVAPRNVQTEVIGSDFDGRDVFESSTQRELAMSLVRQDERHRHKQERRGVLPPAIIGSLITWASERQFMTPLALNRVGVERERAGRSFGRFDGIISSVDLVRVLRERYGAEHVFSASELSLYGKCPFKFFASRVLKLEPRGEAALDLPALDAGRLLHEVLRRFFERHRGERLTSVDREHLRLELRDVAHEVFDEHERVVPPLNPQVWRIDREIRNVMLDQVLAYELDVEEQTQRKNLRPAYFELAFGMKGEQADPGSAADSFLESRRGVDEAVRIRGQIDRVDVAGDGTAIAYDYKLSRGASLRDMIEGRDLQLHIYLAALEQLFLAGHQIAGGGYYILRGAEKGRKRGLYRAGLAEYTGIGNAVKSNLSDDEWRAVRDEMQTRIWEFIDGMRVGRFQVAPSAPEQTCSFCDYAAVCRYEKFRIRRKTEGQTEDR